MAKNLEEVDTSASSVVKISILTTTPTRSLPARGATTANSGRCNPHIISPFFPSPCEWNEWNGKYPTLSVEILIVATSHFLGQGGENPLWHQDTQNRACRHQNTSSHSPGAHQEQAPPMRDSLRAPVLLDDRPPMFAAVAAMYSTFAATAANKRSTGTARNREKTLKYSDNDLTILIFTAE